MLQSSGKLRKSIRVEPSIYQAWVSPYLSTPNEKDNLSISFKKGECIYKPNILKDKESEKKTDEVLQNLKYMLRSMETDFNCLSGERLMEYISKNNVSDSLNSSFSAEKLLLKKKEELEELNDNYLKNKNNELDKIKNLRKEIFCYFNKKNEINNKNNDNLNIDKDIILNNIIDNNNMHANNNINNNNNNNNMHVDNDINNNKELHSCITYGKFRELTLKQEIFLNIIDNWRKNVSLIINENYKDCKYTLEEGFELLEEGIILQKIVKLPEFDLLENAINKSYIFEIKIKKALFIENESDIDINNIKIRKKIAISDLYELLKEGDECIFSSKYLDFLKKQLDNLKSWRSTVESAIIEKNLDKCKDLIKDKDEIYIEFSGIDDLIEEIAASNWIEKVEKYLTRPMRLNFAENLLNEPAAKFLDENNVLVKKQLINRVNKAIDWLNIIQSPPFVYNLVNACKTCNTNEISEKMQLILNDAKKLMETTTDWKFPKPFEFEKIWLESLSLKIIIPIMKYLEPIYIRWRKWHKKFKRLMDGLCFYIEAQLILEEAEYTLCDLLDMSEYLPELKNKLKESNDWLNESKEFLKKLSDFHTKQDIDNVSSNIWNTITGIKKGNEFNKSEIKEIIKYIESQINERLSYDKLKELINKGNELTIYDRSIIQELSNYLDNCERWFKKAKELIKFSRSTNINISSIINLLLERNCILISNEIEENLLAELYFLLWKMDLEEIKPPINDFELNSLIERFNKFKIYIDIPENNKNINLLEKSSDNYLKNQDKNNLLDDNNNNNNNNLNNKLDNNLNNNLDNNIYQLKSTYNSINDSNINIKELKIKKINITHWNKLKELGPINFIKKLQEILFYWNSLILEYEKDKKNIEIWYNLLKDLKELPIIMNQLESKINIFINDYEKISKILVYEQNELDNNLEIKNTSILYSYKKLNELYIIIEKLPININNWDKWLKHINNLNNSDNLTLNKFPYLNKENFINNNNIEEYNKLKIEKNIVIEHLNLINQELISNSIWEIKNFQDIIKDLKYTGKLINDLQICENWINEVNSSGIIQPMNLEYWNQLLEKGKQMRIIDSNILNKFELELNISIEWNNIYQKLTSEINNKTKFKKNQKLIFKKINYNMAELLIGFDLGLNKKITCFKELEDNVKSFIELRNQGFKYLVICYNERKNFNFSKIFEKYKNFKNSQYNMENEYSIKKELQDLNQLTSNLKDFIDKCLKHPISIDFINIIQEEIILREINQKLINTLILEEYPYFYKYLNNEEFCLIEPRILNINDAIELINYIEKNNLNNIIIDNNLNNEYSNNLLDHLIYKYKKNNIYTIEELKKKLYDDNNINISKDIELINIYKEEKYIDIKLFNEFKDMFNKTNQWLNLFNMLGLNLIEYSKIEYFYGKEIPINLLPINVKSSIEFLLQEYINDNNLDIEKNEFNTNLIFEINWNKIFDKYTQEYIKCMYFNNNNNNNKFLNSFYQLLHETNNNYNLNYNSNKIEDKDINENFNNKLNNNNNNNYHHFDLYSNYNISLSINLLHYLRNNKELIINKENGYEYYDNISNSIKSFINEKYFSYLPIDGSCDLDSLIKYLESIKNISESKEFNKLNNSEIKNSSNLLNNNINKRNKRIKNSIFDERVNENNIDQILSIIRNIEMPTIEISLMLISYARKNIKFELIELNNLCLTIELILLWMSLIINKFPNILQINSERIINDHRIYEEKIQEYIIKFEDWEKLVEFNFYNINKHNIANININELINNNNKIIQNTIDLKEYITLIEICDQMPIQMPIKSRLVSNLVDALYWSISAREAILLLPENTIIRPWLHINGINMKINEKIKKSKILKNLNFDNNKYNINDEDILKIFYNCNSYEHDHINFEKNNIDIDLQNKKIPRPRGRPKRESINNKNDLLIEEIYNHFCIEYKEIDQSLNNYFPKSFYMWLLDKNNNQDLNINELKLSINNNENSNISENNISNKLFYGWQNGYFYWYDKNISNYNENLIENKDLNLQQYIGIIDPNCYPKKEFYNNKLIIDYILCMEIFNNMQNTPIDLCSICSTFKKYRIKNDKNLSNKEICLLWITCDECNRWYHQDCVNYNSLTNENLNSWICPICNLRYTKSILNNSSNFSYIKNFDNLLLCNDSFKYININIYNQSIIKNNFFNYKFTIKRELPSQEDLFKIFENSFNNNISYIQLYERNIIANKLYLINIWLKDFYEKFKFEIFDQSIFNPSIFTIKNLNIENTIENDSILKIKIESSDELIDNESEKDLNEIEKVSFSKNRKISRKGRIIKNKISVKEMLNPKISFIKPKKGRKRRILLPINSVTKQIKRNRPIINENENYSGPIIQIDFSKIIPNIILKNINSIDIENITRIRNLEFNQKYLDIEEIINLYIIGILIGINEIIEIEWLYCIIRYSIFFNKKFKDYNQILLSLKSIQIPKDLSFFEIFEVNKRINWDEFKYILKYYSPNFPIKLESSKNFYYNLLKIRFNQLQCDSILNQLISINNNHILINEIENNQQNIDIEHEIIKINNKNFKKNIELLFKHILTLGVYIPQEEIICQILRTYYLESAVLFYKKQFSNIYNNQITPKPVYGNLKNIYNKILKWKEIDNNLLKKYKVRIIPLEMNHLFINEENLDIQNQENKSITRLQYFFDCFDLIQNAIDQSDEWNKKYNLIKENSDEFEIYVELLKQGLNLPCIYPPVYIFGNVLASIESYEDFVDQVYDPSNITNSHLSTSKINNQLINHNLNSNINCNQSLNPKFENIEILNKIKEFLLKLPITKKDLILKIDQMEKNTQSFIQDIKNKIPQIKQVKSSEVLISQLQIIKEEALKKVPIIVTNLPELRELLNNLPDFGSPHHNLLLRTQFLMSIQCPLAKIRKPLNPFPNFSDNISDISDFNHQNFSNINYEIKNELNNHNLTLNKESNRNSTCTDDITSNNKIISCQSNNFLWQNISKQGGNHINYYYHK